MIAKGGRNPSFSPDGSRVAFVTGVGGKFSAIRRFVYRSLDGWTPEKLVPEDIGAANPVWSPDGQNILFAQGAMDFHWAVVLSKLTDATPRTGSPILVPVDTLRKAGFSAPRPRQWLSGNRVLFSAQYGDAAHVFEIGLSPPTLLNTQWRLTASPTRLTFGTGQEDSPSLTSGLSEEGLADWHSRASPAARTSGR